MDARDPRSALSHLLAAEQRRLYRMAYSWCCDAALACDLSQEAMTRALSRFDQLKDMEKFKPWLYAILHNCFLSHLRSRHPDESFEEIVLAHEDAFEPAESAESLSERDETVRQVRNAICKLPLGQREVITLVDLNGCSYAEVACILNLPIGTVMSCLHRARQRLRALIAARSKSERPPKLRLVAE